ncbi:MAG: hypothetical protein FWG05_04795, partial [Kiritimatiellaeota bacterium]|nr:hypothetical protein [Kiritimatiellota bacterium]
NHEPVIIVGPGEDAGRLPYAPARQARSVRDWVCLIAECGAIVAVNSGPMHIADALNKPLVVLEGATHLPLWGPENPHAVDVSHQHELECAPCNQEKPAHVCGAKCMALITPEEVFQAFKNTHEARNVL